MARWFTGNPNKAKKLTKNAKQAAKRVVAQSQQNSTVTTTNTTIGPFSWTLGDSDSDSEAGPILKKARTSADQLETTEQVVVNTQDGFTAATASDSKPQIFVLDGSSDFEASSPISIPRTRKAKSAPEQAASESTSIPQATCHVYIVTPSCVPNAKPTTIPRGTFFFPIDISYAAFLDVLANNAAPDGYEASRASLTLSETFWKRNTPLNDPKKALSSEMGYQAMINTLDHLHGSNKPVELTVYLPPLVKIVQVRFF